MPKLGWAGRSSAQPGRIGRVVGADHQNTRAACLAIQMFSRKQLSLVARQPEVHEQAVAATVADLSKQRTFRLTTVAA